MRFIRFVKYLLVNLIQLFIETYKNYYYGSDNDVRYFKSQYQKLSIRRNFFRDDFKQNFSEISFRVVERFQSYTLRGDFKVKDYFEFGVFNGGSTINFWIGLKAFFLKEPIDCWDFHLFDSFQGMPDDSDDRDYTPRLKKGEMISNGPELLRNKLIKIGISDRKINIFPGFYEQTLSKDLQQEYLRKGIKAHFVNIDCDYYSSTIKVLEWVEPLLEQGSIIYFDDLDLYYRNPYKGEMKAIEEFNRIDPARGIAVDSWIDPSNRCYIYWRDDKSKSKQ